MGRERRDRAHYPEFRLHAGKAGTVRWKKPRPPERHHMNVGGQASSGTVDATLTSLAISMRNLMTQVSNLSTWVNGQGGGLAMLEGLGYPSAGNAGNPGGISDAQLALNMIAYLNTVAEVYFGSATQGTQFNFNQELSQ